MKLHLHRTPALFTLAIILCFPIIWCQETLPYNVCGQSVQCGNVRLDYPFWGSGRPDYCGHSGFELVCRSDDPLLYYQSLQYRVLEIVNSTQTITVARNDLWDDFCPRYLYGTTYNSTLFDGNNLSQENVSLYYQCNFSIPGTPPDADKQFNCDANRTDFEGYFLRTSLIIPGVENSFVQCNNRITVPVSRSSADRLASSSDLRSALRGGFKLRWTAYYEECNRCIRSGGRCGSNSTSPEFACYCASGNFSFTCNNSNGSGERRRRRKKSTLLRLTNLAEPHYSPDVL